MPRWMHRLRAFLGGYFWLPCPICKRPFGGHEWGLDHVLYNSGNTGTGVCPNCKDEADRRNREFFKNNPPPVVHVRVDPAWIPPESHTEILLESETHFPDCGCRVCAEDRAARGEDYWDRREDR